METRKCSLLERQNERTLDLTAEQLQFYRQNEKLVYYFLNKMMISKQQWEELEQIGRIGLIKAIKTFDISKKNKFSTYAGYCIQNEIKMFFRRNQKYQQEISFETVIKSDGSTELTLLDVIKDEKNSRLEEDFFYTERLIKVITILMNEIPFSKSCVIFLRAVGISQEEIGKILGTTQVTIGRRESKAKKELRSRLAEEAKQTRKFIFQVTIQKGKLQISFNPEIVANTKQVLQQLTLKAKENSININFKIYYSNRRAMLQFPLEEESFLLLALLLQIIEESKK